VRIVYSPADALEIARKNPEKEVTFFAIAFRRCKPPLITSFSSLWRY
jgi:hydrogenase expression/formation protein HypD